MAKRTRVPKNNDVVTVYHRSYSPDPPHVGAGGRKSPTRDLHLMTEVAEEDRQHGLIGNADMSELAKTSLEEGIYSGLESDKWESTEGNRLRDNRGVLLGATRDKGIHGPETIFAGGHRTVSSPKFMDRPYTHRYQLPNNAISEEIWGDDDIGMSDVATPISPHNHIPLRRSMVIQSGKVHRMVNSMEGPKQSLNYVIPINQMEHLGIQFKGTRVDRAALDEDYYPRPRQSTVHRPT